MYACVLLARRACDRYFELLNLHPVKVNVTLESGQRSYNMVDIQVDRYTAMQSSSHRAFRTYVGVPTLLSIKEAPIRLDAKIIEHAFISREDLIQRLTAHYRRSGLTELYKILGSADFLGSPTSLIGRRRGRRRSSGGLELKL